MLICPSVCSSDQRYYNVLLRILWILSFFHSIFRLWYYICVVCMCIVYLWLYVLEFKVVSHVQVLQCGIVNNLPTNDSMLFCYNGFMIRITKTWHVWTLCCFVLLNLQTTRHISKNSTCISSAVWRCLFIVKVLLERRYKKFNIICIVSVFSFY